MATARSSAAASTHPAAAEAATQAFHVEPGDVTGTAGTAIDAVVAGVLALCVRHAGVMLGSGTIILGGTGEGSVVIDGRARQPGLGAARPRGFTDVKQIPDAARIAAPLLPHALTLAHAGRGTRSRTALLRYAVDAAKAIGKIDDARVESLKAFGREGGNFLRAGAIRDALLEASARSLGGTLTRDDLDALRPELTQAKKLDVDGRLWAIAPWARALGEHADAAAPEAGGELAVVAAADPYGAVAVAAVLIPTMGTAIGDTGLSAPHLARPVLRGVTREPAGAPLASPAPLGIAQGRSYEGGKSELGPVDLAFGLGGHGDVEALFDHVARRLSVVGASVDEVLAEKRPGEDDGPLGVATGVLVIPEGKGLRSRPLADPRKR